MIFRDHRTGDSILPARSFSQKIQINGLVVLVECDEILLVGVFQMNETGLMQGVDVSVHSRLRKSQGIGHVAISKGFLLLQQSKHFYACRVRECSVERG